MNAHSTRSATEGEGSSIHQSKPKIFPSFMSSGQPAAIKDASGPGTQAGTGEQEDVEIKPTLKYFSTGPFIVKRDFVSPTTKIIGRSNFQDLTQSTL